MSPTKERDIIIRKLVVGPMGVNCYIVADPASGDACVIDPGAEPQKIKNILAREGLSLKFIINTHGHGDHIAANGYFNVPIYIGSLDADFLTDSDRNLSMSFGFPIRSPEASRLLKDGERVSLGALEFRVIHTPGHTPGSISLKLDNKVFTGDALFCGGIGRSDFPYGDEALLLKSIRHKLFALDDECVIHPGHGDSSTIGGEKRSNPFFI